MNSKKGTAVLRLARVSQDDAYLHSGAAARETHHLRFQIFRPSLSNITAPSMSVL
jgi:hypothetical protein